MISDRATEFPLGATVTLETLDADPYPLLAQLRLREPVTWSDALRRWLVTPRELCVRVLMDTASFTTDSASSPIKATFGPQMLSTDGEAQRHHRAPFAPTFRRRALADGIEPAVRERVARLVDAIADEPGAPQRRADIRNLAAIVSVGTVVDVLGLATDDLGLVRSWYDDFAAALANVENAPAIAERGRATAALVREQIGQQLAGALDVTPSRLDAIAEQSRSSGLDDEAFGANVLLILFGGIETMESMILNATWALLRHADALEAVRADRAHLPRAIEESLRWEPAVQTLTRFATRDVGLDGADIGEGEIVECMIGGANRDPDHFRDPDLYLIDRDNASDHLTFGWGRHLCLGLHLARLETGAVIDQLLDRLPGLRLDPDVPSAPRGHEFRKPPRLAVIWD